MTDGKDPATGRFMPGNKFWEVRSSCGANPKFETADQLRAACVEYFTWCHDNPLYADSVTTYQGTTTHEPIAKMRAFTLQGLYMFVDVSQRQWGTWRTERDDLRPVIEWAEAVIYRQKFEGAAADLLNASLIARELGLADKREHSGGMTVTLESDAEKL